MMAANPAGRTISDRRISQIEQMPLPAVRPGTRRGIAHALGMSLDQLDAEWQMTPVEVLEPAGVSRARTSDIRATLEEIAERIGMYREQLVQFLLPLLKPDVRAKVKSGERL